MFQVVKKESGSRISKTVGLVCLMILVLVSCGQGKTDSPESVDIQRKFEEIRTGAPSGTSGKQVPHFQLNDLDGNLFDSAQLKGKVAIINFWATWCIYCKIEIPDLNRLYEKYRSSGLEIVGISMDKEGPEAVKRFMKSHFIDYQVLMGNSEISYRFGGIVGLPTTFIVDRDGTLVKSFPGFVKIDFIEQVVKTLL